MNLYTLHNKPETLHKHDVRKEEVPELAYNDIKFDYKKATPKQLAAIAKSAKFSYQFARLTGRPFKQGEKAIGTDAGWSKSYVEDILNDTKFPAGEKAIGSKPNSAIQYAVYVLDGEFPAGEKAIATSARTAYRYAQLIGKRFKLGEKAISTHPDYAFDYAKDFVRGRWPEGEAAIAKDSRTAMNYIKLFIKKRWPEAEHLIARSPQAMTYIDKYVKKRWVEAEDDIVKNKPAVVYKYVNLWVKEKFPKGETTIKKSEQYTARYNRFLKRAGYSDNELI